MFRMKSLVVGSIVAVMTGSTAAGTASAIEVNINAVTNCNQASAHLKVFLPAGTYKATIVQGLYTAWVWKAGEGWVTTYALRVSDGVTEYTGGNFIDAPTALEAFNATWRRVTYFNQPVDGLVGFYVNDNACSDNTGGVSLIVELQPVPTAETTWGKVKALYR